jgi:BarA-like signal transduction histidine kinase
MFFCNRYDDVTSAARQTVDRLVNTQVEAVLAVGFAGKPQQLLQLLGVDMSSSSGSTATKATVLASSKWEQVAAVSFATGYVRFAWESTSAVAAAAQQRKQ